MDNDYYRLNAVSRFKQLDNEIKKDLDSMVDLVAQVCNTPIALITLIDERTQWFKASKGIDIDCTDRELAFCNYTIKQNDLLVVEDTLLDDRFTSNPLVTGSPYLRFYAGATLTTKDGFAIGSLCVLDFKPRVLDDHQQHTLKVLAKQVMNLMELNWSLHILQKQHAETQVQKLVIEESEIKLNALFNSSKDTHILVDRQLNVVAFNKAAAEFVRNTQHKKLAKGKPIMSYSDPEVVEGLRKMFDQAFNGRTIQREWLMRPGTAYERWKDLQLVPVKNSNSEIIGVALNSTDITEKRYQQDQINIQNAALTRIAIIQSHELRRPVASLLGIISLIKLEKLNKHLDYFDMIEQTINELDEKIKDIVKDSEDTLNAPMSIVA